jgi:hypothetical protein
MWTDVTRAGLLEGVKVIGQIFPSIGQMFIAQMTGGPMPEPPKLNGTNGAAPNGQQHAPQLAGAVPEEKQLIDRFVKAAEEYKVEADLTAADRLFGKDDDSGRPVTAGVFTRAQVAILAAVREGKAAVETLDVLLPDSGSPDAITDQQMMKAMAFITFDMGKDLGRFFSLRKERRAAPSKPN